MMQLNNTARAPKIQLNLNIMKNFVFYLVSGAWIFIAFFTIVFVKDDFTEIKILLDIIICILCNIACFIVTKD